jgi:predicted lipase
LVRSSKNGNLTIRCHEGILISALGLFTKLEILVEELLLPTGYKLLITGHSLGAGVAALLGILLRSRFPRLQLDSNGTTMMLRVVAFASPPILDCDSALRMQIVCDDSCE